MKINRENAKRIGKLALVIIVSVVAGMVLQRTVFRAQDSHDHSEGGDVPVAEKMAETWTCSMHPQIKLPKPGKCPICFMDLIPLEDGADGGGEREVSVSEYAAKLMDLETAEVARKFVEAEVRMVGKIDFDETRVSYISAWVPGRLDRLYINYTGIPVRKGDHMAEIYSPDLLTAQEELLQAIKVRDNLLASESEIIRSTALTTVNASREKLRLLGLTKAQIDEIIKSKVVTDHVTIHAPGKGIVIHKNAQEGMYVQTGSRIYTIADLSSVWVKLDAYESDLDWIRYGGHVEFTSETYPGRTFKGTISFIDPVIDPATRTAKVRVTVQNENLALKPGMFVRAVVRTKVARDGKVMNSDLRGKWISPMHPEIIKDQPGNCDVCDMPLVSAESLGYVAEETGNAPLVIPVSAAMKTGKRAVVYLEVPDKDKPTYEGREITLGPRLGNFYVVASGLKEGDRIVTRGAFKLDAELQIQAKPSMMSDDGTAGNAHAHHAMEGMKKAAAEKKFKVPVEFSNQFKAVVESYLAIQQALADDKPDTVVAKTDTIVTNLKAVDMGLLKGDAHMVWMDHLMGLNAALKSLQGKSALDKQREAFSMLSDQLIQTVQVFSPGKLKMYKASCPMAFDNKGASWIQSSDQIANPYYGEMMLRCGEIEKEIKEESTGGSDE